MAEHGSARMVAGSPSEGLGPATGLLRTAGWVLAVVYIATVSIAVINPSLRPGLMSIVVNLVLVAAAAAHGLTRYRPADLLFFLGSVLIVANVMENTSILTGFPFGHYHYTAELGPKLFNVPIMIGVIYAAAGYFAWTVGTVIVRVWRPRLRGSDVWIVPLAASVCMVAWDVSMDPIKSTIQQEWIWRDGGAYFGVPLQNYFGWFLTTWIFFQAFALWMSRSGGAESAGVSGRGGAPAAGYWLLGILIYAAMGLQGPLGALMGSAATVTDGAGQQWPVDVIRGSLGLITVFTMWAYALFAALTVIRSVRR